MIHVKIFKQGNFPISSKKIKDAVSLVFSENGIVSPSVASVALVGTQKMKTLVDKYYSDNEKHLVLSFPTSEMEGPFVFPPDGKNYLGDIIISYPDCVLEAKEKNRLIDDVVLEYAKHGALHLIGIHHD